MKNIIASSLRMRKFRQQIVKSKKIYNRKKTKYTINSYNKGKND